MICACLKHPLHCTAILRRLCLGCACSSKVVTECFDSACYCLTFCLCRCAHPWRAADLVPRLWTRLTTDFQSAFIDVLHECCKMGLGELPQMINSLIAAFCSQTPSSESPVSASLLRLLAILRSHDYLSAHATPSVATALLHAAVCFRSDFVLAVECCDAAVAVVDACRSISTASGCCGPGAWPADHDGSTAALAWSIAHIFDESPSEHRKSSIACSALWNKFQSDGTAAAHAAALRSVPHRAGSRPLSTTQRLVRLLDTLPIQEQCAIDADRAIPWSVRHHLSWMIQAEREQLLQQLVPIWISRSSFRPLWVLQCAVQSPGDAVRYFALLRSWLLWHAQLFTLLGGGSSRGWFCCTSSPSRAPKRSAARAACCFSWPWVLSRTPLQIETLSIFSVRWWKVMRSTNAVDDGQISVVYMSSSTLCLAFKFPIIVTQTDQHLDAIFAASPKVTAAAPIFHVLELRAGAVLALFTLLAICQATRELTRRLRSAVRYGHVGQRAISRRVL